MSSYTGSGSYTFSGRVTAYPGGNPLAIWHLDGNATDSSGNAFDATAVGGPTYTSSPIQGQYITLSSGKYLDAGNPSGLQLDYVNPFSVSLWFKTTSLKQTFIAKEGAVPAYRGWMLEADVSGHVTWGLIHDYTSQFARVITTSAYSDGAWHHLVATYDGSGRTAGLKVYIDTVPQTTTVESDTLSELSVTNSSNLQIGATGGNNGYNGSLDEVGLYTGVLTTSQIATLYSAYQRYAGTGTLAFSGSVATGYVGTGTLTFSGSAATNFVGSGTLTITGRAGFVGTGTLAFGGGVGIPNTFGGSGVITLTGDGLIVQGFTSTGLTLAFGGTAASDCPPTFNSANGRYLFSGSATTTRPTSVTGSGSLTFSGRGVTALPGSLNLVVPAGAVTTDLYRFRFPVMLTFDPTTVANGVFVFKTPAGVVLDSETRSYNPTTGRMTAMVKMDVKAATPNNFKCEFN